MLSRYAACVLLWIVACNIVVAVSSEENLPTLEFETDDEFEGSSDTFFCRTNPLMFEKVVPLWGCDEIGELWEHHEKYNLQEISHGHFRRVYKGEFQNKQIVYKHLRDNIPKNEFLIEKHRRE